jgi:SAM-dependent methyltransferase
MDARLQRRIQRYGWDLAAARYDDCWHASLSPAQAALLDEIALQPGECVLDVACGTGLVTLAAADRVGPAGRVTGTDISERMVERARQAAAETDKSNASFERMDAESLQLPENSFDVATCALGLMYLPDPEAALRDMFRVLRPQGRIGVAIWGARRACGWSSLFPIVDARVQSEVCPLFFRLGEGEALAVACRGAGFTGVRSTRLQTFLHYDNADAACDAAFEAGPVALAWSRFDTATRESVRVSYLDSLLQWRSGAGYRVPGEFVVVTGYRQGHAPTQYKAQAMNTG